MTFKRNHEKTSVTHPLPHGLVEKMAQLAYPNKKLLSHALLSGGCANLNLKVLLEGVASPLLLRVYLRDKDAAYREQKIGALLKKTVPAPLTDTIGTVEGYHFAMTEFMPGITLRDLLLGNTPHDIRTIMHEVGTTLSKITAHKFPQAGSFDKDLNVIPHTTAEGYQAFAQACLQNQTVLSVLAPKIIAQIGHSLDQHGHLFPDNFETHLVHADFDPANILVDHLEGTWKVSGVLDWEFAFSGSILCDVANMLRYAHKMPTEFQKAFLQGLRNGGIVLPHHWQIPVHLLNLLSLLDCLKRSDPNNRPLQCADICELIHHAPSTLKCITRSSLRI